MHLRMSDFEPLPEHRLSKLNDDQLIEHVIAAREAGDLGQTRLAMSILAFGHYQRVYVMVSMKVPADSVDDVAQEVMAHALKSSFDGRSVGQFVSWLKTITSRRIADFTERATRERERQAGSLTGDEDDEVRAEALGVDGGQSQVEVTEIVMAALEQTDDPVHRRVVELYGPGEFGFAELSAREVASTVNGEGQDGSSPMSEGNVHKIYQRFRDRVRVALDSDGGGS